MSAVPTPASSGPLDQRATNRARFELELEFVQCLANPYYLYSLGQQGLLDQTAFINFLDYLQYWKEKEYARFIHYPHALHHLDLLQYPSFRSEIKTEQWRECLAHRQFEHWRTWRDPVHLNAAATAPQPDARSPTVQDEQQIKQENPNGNEN